MDEGCSSGSSRLVLAAVIGLVIGGLDHISLLTRLSAIGGVGVLGLYAFSSFKRMGAKNKMYEFLKKTAVISDGQERSLDKSTMLHVETLRSQYLEDYREIKRLGWKKIFNPMARFLCWGESSTKARESFYENLAYDATLSVVKKAILFSKNSFSLPQLSDALGRVEMKDIPKLALEVSEMKDVPLHRITAGINAVIKI